MRRTTTTPIWTSALTVLAALVFVGVASLVVIGGWPGSRNAASAGDAPAAGFPARAKPRRPVSVTLGGRRPAPSRAARAGRRPSSRPARAASTPRPVERDRLLDPPAARPGPRRAPAAPVAPLDHPEPPTPVAAAPAPAAPAPPPPKAPVGATLETVDRTARGVDEVVRGLLAPRG